MAKTSIACDVVILPDATLAAKAIMTSDHLKQFNSLFVLEDGAHYPHASLYMLQLKISDIDHVKALLADIATHTRSLDLEAKRYDHTQAFLDVEYQRTPQLDRLQQRVITALNPLRDDMREKDKIRMLEATGIALENLKNYGYTSVGALFRPHITFTRLSKDNSDALKALEEIAQYSGIFPKIGLFEMGDNGTCVREFGTWELV